MVCLDVFKKLRSVWLFAILLCGMADGFAQAGFSVELRPSDINALPPVQSGAYASWDGKWIFIGGRTNGMHGFLPPSSFPFSNINDSVFVVDPLLNQRWAISIASLPDDLREPLTSSNMEFFQDSARLYMVGGYGWKTAQNNFVTFNTLTAVNLPCLLDAVMNHSASDLCMRQTTDSVLAVCGGHLERLNNVYQLVFGHDFEGFYSINASAGFYSQKYTCEVRRFEIVDDGVNLSLHNYSALRDTENFHRRDYNLVPQVFLDESYGLTAFSGVFQYHANLPYTGTVDITNTGALPNNQFVQQFANYHCAVMPVYNAASHTMSTVFFGGMGMFYQDTLTRQVICDTLVPFVNTVSMVTRDGLGQLSESLLPINMPGYLGTNAFFLANDSLSLINKTILNLSSLDTLVLAGYIVSGITSADKNISSINSTLSEANTAVYEVWMHKVESQPGAIMNADAMHLQWATYPNPVSDRLQVAFTLPFSKEISLDLLDLQGKRVRKLARQLYIEQGKQLLSFDCSDLPSGNYICRLQSDGRVWTRLISVRNVVK